MIRDYEKPNSPIPLGRSAGAFLFPIRSQQMMFPRSKKAVRLISLIAITLTSLIAVTLVQITHAERPQSQREKVSSLLKGNKYSADENVTVIVMLNGPRSNRLNALLKQNGVRQRREMKSQRSFSLSLPFRMVTELASFPEVSYISSNEVVHS